MTDLTNIWREAEPSFSLSIRSALLSKLVVLKCLYVLALAGFAIYKSDWIIFNIEMAALLFFGLALLFNSKDKFLTAIVVYQLTDGLLTIFIATSEPSKTGAHIHFASAIFVSVFLYQRPYLSRNVVIALLSIMLALSFAFYNHTVPFRHFKLAEIHVLLILNSFTFGIQIVYLVYVTIKANHKAENQFLSINDFLAKQNNALIKANSELESFIYSASHDLRSPLSSIQGLVTLSVKDQSFRAASFSMMNERTEAMNHFLNELVQYSRNTKLKVVEKQLNLKSFLEEVIEPLKYSYDSEKFEFRIAVNAEVRLVVDPNRLGVVISNLVSNCIKYQDHTKEIQFVEITSECAPNAQYIHIKDNGIGIPEKHQAKIFDMFYRATERSKGTGLGLYIVKETLSKMSASIKCQSEHGVGTTFTIAIPDVPASS